MYILKNENKNKVFRNGQLFTNQEFRNGQMFSLITIH